MKKNTLLSLVAGALILSTQTIYAHPGTSSHTFPEPRPAREGLYQRHIGVIGGVTSPEGSYEATGEYGVDVGFQPMVPFSLGAEFTVMEFDQEGVLPEIDRMNLLVKAGYNFGGEIPVIKHSYIGMGLGPSFEDVNGDDDMHLGIMPNAGFDIPLGKNDDISLGANLRYFITTSNSSPDDLSLRGMVKFWL